MKSRKLKAESRNGKAETGNYHQMHYLLSEYVIHIAGTVLTMAACILSPTLSGSDLKSTDTQPR